MTLPDYLQYRERPLGISILAVIHFLGGVALIFAVVMLGFVISDEPKFDEMLAEIGFTRGILIAGLVVLAVLSLASAIGMWTGARWGWYLGSFYYAYAIVRNTAAIINLSSLTSEVDQALQSDPMMPGRFYVKFGGRLVVSFLLYLYFFKSNVRAYFGLETVAKWQAVLLDVLICVCIFVVGSLVNLAFL